MSDSGNEAFGVQGDGRIALCWEVHKQNKGIGIESLMPMTSLYDTLEVSPQASPSVIRAAYRCLAQLHHPDKHLNCEEAGRRLSMINFAYSVLADPSKRRGYDIRQGIEAAFVERRGLDAMPKVRHAGNAGGDFTCRPFAFRPLV
jgi:DnaJ-class molecular chaperone